MDLPAHQLTMTVLMTPDTANFAGNVHGGTLLKLLDQVAYASCTARPACPQAMTDELALRLRAQGAGFNLPQVRALYAPLLAAQPKDSVQVHQDERYGAHERSTAAATTNRLEHPTND